MNDFSISFVFIDNLGEDAIATIDRRWNGVTVTISKSRYGALTAEEQWYVLKHECLHAIAEFGPAYPER